MNKKSLPQYICALVEFYFVLIIWFCADVEKYLCFRISHLCLCISARPAVCFRSVGMLQ